MDNEKMKKNMKKVLLFAAAALLLGLSACQNVEPQAPASDEVVLSLSASIGDPGTRTVFVPEGGKVNWVAGDKIMAKYPAGKDNVTLTLATGAGTTSATFTGKIANTTNTNLATDPSDFVFYYPGISGVGKGGTVTDADNFVLENTFPKVQNSADILFEANWLYGTAKAQDLLNTVGKDYTMEFAVSMKNLMAVLDFTFIRNPNGASIKRIFVTDLDENAPALWGSEKLTVENGAVKSLVLEGSGTNDYDRTIIAEFNKTINLSESGTHIYVTIFPRKFSKGLRIAVEDWNGDKMIKNLAEAEGFTLESGKVYQVPEITFNSNGGPGKDYYDGVEYTYETYVDPRDHLSYRVATLKDGRTWMLQNLRYIPSGVTPENDLTAVNNGIWFPVLMNDQGTGVAFSTDYVFSVVHYGYTYNFSTAMGKEPDYAYKLLKEVLAGTKTQAEVLAELKTLEGKQGICPDGWHVPTLAEYNALYAASGSSMSGLGAQGFVLKDCGALMINNPSATSDPASGTLLGYASNKMNTGYYILSTPNSYNNLKAIMPNVTNNAAAVANMNIRCGAPLRCIKDK